jgi:glycosyltransferase involved in cell wall biosynthesis
VPAFKAGGPLRSIWNLVEALGDEFEFYVYTRDRDEGDIRPFANVQCDKWVDVGKAKVFYASPSKLSALSLGQAIGAVSPAVVYLNSAFAPMSLRVLMLRKLGIVCLPTIVAPRNELSPGALSVKSAKKRWFLRVARGTRLYNEVVWQCSNDEESEQVRRLFTGAATATACDVATPIVGIEPTQRPTKEQGVAKFVYLSRVSPKKNLLTALRALKICDGAVTFDIYGPIQDAEYWKECLAVIERMPSNVDVAYRGALPAERVRECLDKYHFFVLPTLGENFGHAIHEALSVDLPVVIGNGTPWAAVASTKAGWILDPDVAAWQRAMREAIMMASDDYRAMAARAGSVARECGGYAEAIRANARMLNAAAGVQSGTLILSFR